MQFFYEFRLKFGLHITWPAPIYDIVCFIAELYQNGLSHSTISCYLSGVSFYHKINNLEDNSQKFVVRKMLEGMKRSVGRKPDSRLPITKVLLKRIILCLPCVCNSFYESKLFSSAFSLCFYGFLRVGEISVSNSSRHVLEFGNVKVLNDCIELALSSSKTDQTGIGTTIRVQGQSDKAICPLVLLTNYLYARPPYHKGPLFCHFDGSPLSRYQVSSVLTKALRILGVDPSRYSTHSLRIGAATTCAMEGVSDEKIMQFGRWKSAAYKSYIRINS